MKVLTIYLDIPEDGEEDLLVANPNHRSWNDDNTSDDDQSSQPDSDSNKPTLPPNSDSEG